MDSQFFGVLQFWPDKQVQKFLKTGVSKMIQACSHHVGTWCWYIQQHLDIKKHRETRKGTSRGI